ncbi:MAG: DUF2723 domain-containing protein [Candidatus Eisenbacteria bacterium]
MLSQGAAPRTLHSAWSAGVGAAFGALYLALAPHVTGPKDAAEFTLVLALNGVPHPTGYPTYVMFGHHFVRLVHALGANWAYAANAWSALGGGVAMALLHALATRMVPARLPLGHIARFSLGLVPVAIFGVNPIWLLDAIFAETYTWHLVWVCGAGLFMQTAMRVVETRDAAALTRTAAAWGLLCGIGLAHHLTSVLLVAVFSAGLIAALVRAGKWRLGLVIPTAAGAVLPLLAYSFVAWRAFHPAAYQWGPLEPAWWSVFAHIRGSAYGDLLGRFAPDEVQRGLLANHVYPVHFPALVLLAVAVLLARRGERLVLATFAGAAGVQTLYAFNYGVRDPSSYFQPALTLALLSLPPVGAWLLTRRQAAPPRSAAAGAAPAAPSRPVAVVAAVLALAGVVALGARGLPLGHAIRLGAEETDRRMRATWDRIPQGAGFVLWDHDMATTFQVYQQLEGQRPELFAGNPATLSWPAPRRAFRDRFGFDPLDGLEPLTAARALQIPANMSRQTPLPVTVFDLYRQQVTILPKPGQAPLSTSRP